MVNVAEKTRPSSSRHGSNRSASTPTDIPDEKKTNSRAYSNWRSIEDRISAWRRIGVHKERSKPRSDHRYCRFGRSPSLKVSFADKSVQRLNVIVPINERYWPAVDYKSYQLIHKTRPYHEYVTSEIQMMRKKIAVQIKDYSFSGKSPISITNFLTGLKQAWNLSGIHEGTALWLYPDFMTGPALTMIKVRFSLSSNDVNTHRKQLNRM